MKISNHINTGFDEDLKTLNNNIAKLGGLAETQLYETMQSLADKNVYKFNKIINRDKKLDALEDEINKKVVEFLAIWSPIASDLRNVLVAHKISSILERIGDYSKNISRRSLIIIEDNHFSTLPVNIIGLGEHVQKMLHNVLDAYMERDVDLAMEIWSQDIDIDRLYLSLFKELTSIMHDNPEEIKDLTHMVFISKNLERIGDHATAIAKQIYFLVNGSMPPDHRPKAGFDID